MKIYATQKNTKAKLCNDIGLTLYVLSNDSFLILLFPLLLNNIHQHTTELSKQIQTFSTSPYPFKIIFKNLMLQYTTTFINIKTSTHSCQSINIFTRDIVFYYCANSVKLFYFDFILL